MKNTQYLLSLGTVTASRLLQGVVMVGTAVVVTTKAATTLIDGVMQVTTATAEKAIETLGNSAQNAEAAIKQQNAEWAEKRKEKKAMKQCTVEVSAPVVAPASVPA